MTDGDRLRNLTERLDTYLRASGRRVTPERHAVLDVLYASTRAMSSAEVCRELDERGYHVASATVYNALSVLCDAGVARKSVSHNGRRATVIYGIGARESVMTLRCTECGKARELRDNTLLQAIADRKYPRFALAGFTLQVNGICSRCQRLLRKKAGQESEDEKSKTKRPLRSK